MKEIERFLNHLYFAAYKMTAWISFVPYRKNVEYESSLELTWLLHGLCCFYIFDFLAFAKVTTEYAFKISIVSIIGELVFTHLLFAITIIADCVIFHHFVYKGKKYLKYCEEFDKGTELEKFTWCALVVILYLLAVIILGLIFIFGRTHLPMPV